MKSNKENDFFTVYEENGTKTKYSYEHYCFDLIEISEESNMCRVLFNINGNVAKTYSNVLLQP